MKKRISYSCMVCLLPLIVDRDRSDDLISCPECSFKTVPVVANAMRYKARRVDPATGKPQKRIVIS